MDVTACLSVDISVILCRLCEAILSNHFEDRILVLHAGASNISHMGELRVPKNPGAGRYPLPLRTRALFKTNKTPFNRGTADIPLLCLSHEKVSTPSTY